MDSQQFLKTITCLDRMDLSQINRDRVSSLLESLDEQR